MVGIWVFLVEVMLPPNTLLLLLWPMVNHTPWEVPDGESFVAKMNGLHQIKDPVYGDQCNI